MLNITAARKGKSSKPMLDMAPLIDMVFILLIFFLVNTSYVKETGIEVSRPTAATASVKDMPSILIAIDKENRIFMDHREIDLRAIRANVDRALVENPEGAVVVIADKASNTGIAIQVIDNCRLAGTNNVSLAAGLPEGS